MYISVTYPCDALVLYIPNRLYVVREGSALFIPHCPTQSAVPMAKRERFSPLDHGSLTREYEMAMARAGMGSCIIGRPLLRSAILETIRSDPADAHA